MQTVPLARGRDMERLIFEFVKVAIQLRFNELPLIYVLLCCFPVHYCVLVTNANKFTLASEVLANVATMLP